jgi:hypothetical protein
MMATNVFKSSLEPHKESTGYKELPDLVGDVAVALIEVLSNLSSSSDPHLYRDLKIALAPLVAEIKSSEILQAIAHRQSLRTALKNLARSLSGVLNGEYIKDKYRHLMQEEANMRTRRLSLFNWYRKEEEEESLEAFEN